MCACHLARDFFAEALCARPTLKGRDTKSRTERTIRINTQILQLSTRTRIPNTQRRIRFAAELYGTYVDVESLIGNLCPAYIIRYKERRLRPPAL
ncbi:unnamed protein product [Rangifer tarandus platyrhynchus]|uniref:Transposase n=1 Tax=Rangifer tarandus platyrhynchus TaxID=3082113 RepID=A0ABN8XNJ4_RANTA|nr:unnamed protein product [Rangifer tarandus platyrhynchus]